MAQDVRSANAMEAGAKGVRSPILLVLMLAIVLLGVCGSQAWHYLSESGGAAAAASWQPARPNMLPELASLCKGAAAPAANSGAKLQELKAKLAA
eukprot:3151170-Prymnesium_polylepis.1